MTEKNAISWLPVILLIAGLSIGYTIVILRSDAAFASSNSCPASKEICINGNCDEQKECADGKCSDNCLGNCNR